jgi:hypothetical protein
MAQLFAAPEISNTKWNGMASMTASNEMPILRRDGDLFFQSSACRDHTDGSGDA